MANYAVVNDIGERLAQGVWGYETLLLMTTSSFSLTKHDIHKSLCARRNHPNLILHERNEVFGIGTVALHEHHDGGLLS